MSSYYLVIISLSIILIILLFVYTDSRKQKKKKAAQDEHYQNLVMRYELSVNTKEETVDYILALDERAKKLLLLIKDKSKLSEKLIDLKAVKTCNVASVSHTYFMDDKKTKTDELVSQMGLLFSFKNKEEDYFIPFYDYVKHNILVMGELRSKAEQWEGHLRPLLEQQSKSEKAR